MATPTRRTRASATASTSTTSGRSGKKCSQLEVRTQSRDRPYACDFEGCVKRFARNGQLQVHRRTHSGEKPYECDICHLKFTSSGNLRTHQKLHTGNRDFQCSICNKSYPRADTLKRHMLSFHENKKLYTCPICHKSFKGHLRDHLRTHSKQDTDKPYGCNQCGARFNQRSQLTVHIRVHTGERPYECKICSRRFSHSTALKLHLRMHTGERPHVCKLCSKAFAQLPHLKKHMLCVHNTDKPYYCAQCKIFFKIKLDFQQHVEQAHPHEVPEDLLDVLKPLDKESEVNNVDSEPDVDDPHADLDTEKDDQSLPVDNDEDDELEATEGEDILAVVMSSSESGMPLEKMRTLVALLLKKISTASRLKKLGFGTRLIDEVLCESIEASGRVAAEGDNERERLLNNVEILLNWTIPQQYMETFKAERKSVEHILEELAS